MVFQTGWSFLSFPCGMGCLGAEFFPVVSVVADEVGDFTKSLVRYGHVFGMKGEIVLMFDEL
jgi:hypothetical protein